MPRSDVETTLLIRQARTGCNEALGRLLNGYLGYLLRIAGDGLDPRLQAKGGASDIVQETFLEAQRDFVRFKGHSERELLAWLRQRVEYRAAKFVRCYRRTAKRSTAREVPLDEGGSSSAYGPGLAADQLSPSERVVAAERDHLLYQAMDRLPDDYRRVLQLRYREGLSFEEIGSVLIRSPNSARKLWARAIERLKCDLRGITSP
jgi:RNA polymerase sigma-70 factor (ECF subfamily)